MRQLSFHDQLSTCRALFGLLQTQPNSAIAELAGMCGYDFLLLDGEHGTFCEGDYLHTVQILAARDILSVVRLPRVDMQAVGRYLDMGVNAILVPNVSNAEQAKALVRAMQYPPAGTRGFGASLHRATRYGLDLGAHLQVPRQRAGLIVMIESALGVSNIEEIAAIEGVDGVFIGLFDLSADLGCLGDFTQAAYAKAVARVERATLAEGKILGTAPHPGHSLEALLTRGHRLFLVGADMVLIREAMVTQVTKAQSCLSTGAI